MSNTKYIYDDITNEFVREQVIEYDYHDNEVVYSGETLIVPPKYGDNEIPVFNEETQQWILVKDYRNKQIYLNGKEGILWEDLGELPEGATLEPIQGAITLEEAKATVKQNINGYRDFYKFYVFEYNGNVFDCTQNSITSIIAYEIMARNAATTNNPFEPVEWRAKDNTEVLLTGDDFIGMMEAYAIHTSVINSHAIHMKNKIMDIIIPDGDEPLSIRERMAIDMVEAYPIDFSPVVVKGYTIN